jgi:hypothetical protein
VVIKLSSLQLITHQLPSLATRVHYPLHGQCYTHD